MSSDLDAAGDVVLQKMRKAIAVAKVLPFGFCEADIMCKIYQFLDDEIIRMRWDREEAVPTPGRALEKI